ncbi:ISNCY family transposase [Microvirga sp. VF16]
MDLAESRLTARQAANMLRLTERQVWRLLGRFRHDGAAGLASRKRGRVSNRRLHPALREITMSLVRVHYADFGPTLAAEKLAERHDLRVGRETLRKWMMEDGLWLDRRRRLPSVHQPRNRRERMGELIQIDGSKHWWFENRGPQCTLLAYIDDATSQLLHAAFVSSESTFDYLRETHKYVTAHGRPIAFYSDKHAIFRVSKTEAEGGDGMTQFGRAMHELNIDIICANTAPAKGRIERSFGTLQDRLVKEMRLQGISTIAAANAFLPGFLADHNQRFAKAPFSNSNAHRSVAQDMVLEDIFAWKEERTVTHNLTLQYDKVMFLLEPNEMTRPLARQRVTVIDYPDGRLAIRHKGIDLPYRTYDKLQRVTQAAIVENKRLGPVLAYVAQLQQERDEQRSAKAPRRRGQADRHMFKVS